MSGGPTIDRAATDRRGAVTPVSAVGLSGLGTTGSRVVMLLVWVAFTVVTLRGDGVGPSDLVALAVLVPSLWLVTSPVPEPISPRLAVLTLTLAGGAAVIVVDPGQSTIFLTAALMGYVFAFVMIRGQAAIAIGGYLLTAAVMILRVRLAGRGEEMEALVVATFPEVLWSPAALVLALGWRAILRRSQQQLADLAVTQSASAVAEAETRVWIAAWSSRLEDLSGDVMALLERGASGTLRPGDRELAARLELGLRDELRAPRLAVAALNPAIEAARDRGVAVVLLDDGDPDSALQPTEVAAIIDQLAEAPDGSRLTVRLLPQGRSAVGTMVLEADGRLSRATL